MLPADADWQRLQRLRSRFLHDAADPRPLADYWESDADLEAYDAVFAARIGWKWDALFASLRERGITLEGPMVYDYGCGTGIATRRLLAHVESAPARILLHDRSERALGFARRKVRETLADRDAEVADDRDAGVVDDRDVPHDCDVPDDRDVPDDCGVATTSVGSEAVAPDLLLVSHVLGELSSRAERDLLGLVGRSRTVIFVEPGTRGVSRRLSAIRDGLLPRFDILAPCTHQARCGALLAGENDWCHFFAPPPAGVFTDSTWVKAGKKLGIDLRSLPYATLVARRRDGPAGPAPAATRARLVGRPHVRPKLARFFTCDADGLRERTAFKNRDAVLYRALRKAPPESFDRAELPDLET